MTDLLVTGTDTGVGKTVIAAALVLALRESGARALGFKPAETGLGAGEPADSQVLAAASGLDEPLAQPLLRLSEPLAPAVAAERAGIALEPRLLEERVGMLRAAGYRLVVEGAGGLLAPLAWGFTALDLARRCRFEAVLVARAGLGTLNHVALSAEVMRAAGVPLRAVVLNARAEPPSLAEATNPGALARLLPGVTVRVVPRHVKAEPLAAARHALRFVTDLAEVC